MATLVVAFNGAKAVDAELASGGWNAGNDDSDNFVEGTQSIGLKVSGVGATQDFYDQSIAGGPYDFSSGGGNEGEHIWGWFNTLTPANSHEIIIGENNATTDAIGRYNVGPPVGYGGGWISYVIDPETDFTGGVIAGTPVWTTTGNPAQLTVVDIAGGHHEVGSMISGNFNNALVDATSIGFGYRYTRGDGASTPGDFSDIISFEETVTNRFGALRAQAGVLFAMCQLHIGAVDALDHEFVADGFTVIWLDQVVAAAFYGLFVEEDTGTTIVTLSNGTFNVESVAQAALPAFDFSSGTVALDTINIVGAHATNGITLGAGTTVTNGVWTDCGQITAGGSTVTGLTILDPTNDGAVLVTGVDDLDNWNGVTFDGAGVGGATTDAAIEFNIAAAGPHTIDLNTITFQNRVGSSVDLHFLDQGADRVYTVNVNGGTTATFTKDRAGDTVTIVSSVTQTLKNVISGSQCSIHAVDDDSELMNETAAGGDVTESYGGSTPRNVIIRVRNASGSPQYIPYVASGQIVANTGLTVTVDQIEAPV